MLLLPPPHFKVIFHFQYSPSTKIWFLKNFSASREALVNVEEKVVVVHRGRCNNKVYCRLSHDVVT